MKHLTFLLFTSVMFFGSIKAQSNHFEIVYGQFVSEYKANLVEKKNYFSAMYDASKKIFVLTNPDYANLIKKQISKNTGKTITQLSESAFDSLMSAFLEKDLWCDNRDAKIKYKQFFDLSYNKVCNCISPTFLKNINRKAVSNPLDSCMMVLNSDQSYIQQIRVLAGKYTQTELIAIGNYYSRYLFEQCVAFKNDMLYTMKISSASMYQNDLHHARSGILMNIIQSYGKDKSISEIFPSYKIYEIDLKKAVTDLHDNRYTSLYSQNPKQKAETEEITKTYFYYKDGKAFLKCRIIYVVTNELGHPLLKSLKYIEPSKIPDRKKILKDLNEDDQTEIINIGKIEG